MAKSSAELAADFDKLPDDFAVPAEVWDILTNRNRETRRRNPPPLRRIQFSVKRYGYRVGDIRKLIRGELANVAQG
jgi:hypothetical protein